MKLEQFDIVVDKYVEFMEEKYGEDPFYDNEALPEGELLNQLRERTGIDDLDVIIEQGLLRINVAITCNNHSCRAEGVTNSRTISVPIDRLYRVICYCGKIPTVIAVFEDGIQELEVGGVVENG